MDRLDALLRAVRGPGGKLLVLRLAYGFLLRGVYSLHALYEVPL